jgi:DNA processing protein
MDENIEKLNKELWPEGLFEIPQKPKEIFIQGKFPDKYKYKFLCVVGSRKHSSYAVEAIKKLLSGLVGRNIVIVSGLAIGIDTIAHKIALENNLITIAVLGTGVTNKSIYPRSNFRLAKEILNRDGCIISEFKEETPQVWSFPARNRIMVGICDAVLVIEANEKSGTLITARMALDYNKELLVVPTTIFSSNGQGSNKLLKEGAKPVFDSNDVLEALNMTKNIVIPAQAGIHALLNINEKVILDLINKGTNTFDDLTIESQIETSELSQTLMEMEIKGILIKTLGKYEIIN